MTEIRRVIRIRASGWMVFGVWVWLPGAVVVWLWLGEQARLGWWQASTSVLVTVGVIMGARWVSALIFNYLAPKHAGWLFIREAGAVVRVQVRKSLGAITITAVPFGVLTGLVINVWGWVNVVPDHWIVVPIALGLSAELYGILSLVIYNEIIVRFYGPIVIRDRTPHGGERVLMEVQATSIRRVATMWYFSWFVAVLVCGFAVAGLLLTFVAHHIPAKTFGVEVGLFAFMLSLCGGYVVSVVVGWWYFVGAKCYERTRVERVIWWEESVEGTSS